MLCAKLFIMSLLGVMYFSQQMMTLLHVCPTLSPILRGIIQQHKRLLFIVCAFGSEKLEMTKKLRVLLASLSDTLPQASIVIGLSPGTIIPDHFGAEFNLSLEFAFVNSTDTPLTLAPKHSRWDIWLAMSALRSMFHRDYLIKHPEVDYVFCCDQDTMILKDPMVLVKDPETVHIRYDAYPLTKVDDMNFMWLRAWDSLPEDKKMKCGLRPLKHKLTDPEIANEIPLNVGLLFGKAKNILKIVSVMADRFACAEPWGSRGDQGLLNYLRFSGELNSTGVKIHGYHLTEELVSCPELMGHAEAYIHGHKIVAMHHWNYVDKSRLPLFGKRIATLAEA